MTEPLPEEPAPPSPSRPRLSPRVLALAAVLALALAVLGLVAYRVWFGGARQALIRRMEHAERPFPRADLDRAGRRFRGDRELLGASLLLAGDARAGDAARWNALLVANAVAPGTTTGPATFGQLDWQDGQVRGAKLADLTFSRGRWTSIAFADTTFAGVTWGPAFAGGKPGLFLSGVRFERCRFLATAFAGTHLTRVDLLDSAFSGATLDLSNFDHVRFAHSPRGAAAIADGEVINRGQAPPAGVDDLALPAEQVRFEGVAFSGVHFRGWIRPEWFAGCTFTRCVFPLSLRREALAAGHNAVHGGVWSDEPLD